MDGCHESGDTEKLGQILADDWTGLGNDGKKSTKQSYLAAVKAGKSKLESFEFGPMDVKVLGNVAVVQGSDTEKSTTNGKDSSVDGSPRLKPGDSDGAKRRFGLATVPASAEIARCRGSYISSTGV